MVLRSLIAAAAVLAVGAPLAAQSPPPQDDEAWVWSANRPDAYGTLGVFGSRTLEASELELTYNYWQENYRGIWFGKDSLPLADVQTVYTDVPLTRSEIRHQVRLGFGISDALTFIARGEFVVLERETAANNGLIRTAVQQIGDVEAGLLYNIFGAGPYRMNAQVGAVIPTVIGTSTYADTTAAQSGSEVVLPYDMRTSAGTFGVVGALGGSVQNEFGSLGAQFRMRVNFLENNAGATEIYTPGDVYEANGWAGYNINEHLAIMAGVRWQSWGNIEGADDRLTEGADPHNVAGMLAGQRVLAPVGLNFVMPEQSILAGHVLSLEALYTMHHDYEGPQLGMDWGINLGYTLTF